MYFFPASAAVWDSPERRISDWNYCTNIAAAQNLQAVVHQWRCNTACFVIYDMRCSDNDMRIGNGILWELTATRHLLTRRWAHNFIKPQPELKTALFRNMTTREPNSKIILIFVAGLGLCRIRSRRMVSDQVICGTFIRMALRWALLWLERLSQVQEGKGGHNQCSLETKNGLL